MAADAGVQVTELGAEDHACLTFGESEELFDLTAAFVDARCTLMIADAARTVASQSRQVTLRCLPEVATGFKRIGLADLDGIRLVADGDR